MKRGLGPSWKLLSLELPCRSTLYQTTMESDPEARTSIHIGFYSVLGALLGGVTGSWASTAFGESAAFDIVSTLLIFGVGGFLGLMAGTAFHDLVRGRYGKRAGKRVEWTGRFGIAGLGLICILLAQFVLVISMEGELQLPPLSELLLSLAIAVFGIYLILISMLPAIYKDTE